MNNYIGIDIEISNTPTALKNLYSKLKKTYKKEIEDVVFIYARNDSSC
ncbi:MAG: hypothetical protein L3I99_07160 [Sulfurimonas sp.]|nr:hypothetical protein [Sulfurimonas sp.]